MPQPYIIFTSKDQRRMTVIDGLPYYESTGKNSNRPGVWFPFLSLRGTKELNYRSMPKFIIKRGLKEFIDHHNAVNFIIKCKAGIFRDHTGFTNENRRPTKDMVITSTRLTRNTLIEADEEKYFKEAQLTETEMTLAITPIVLEDKPTATFTSADEANEWLISQGAIIAKIMLTEKPKPVVEENPFLLFSVPTINRNTPVSFDEETKNENTTRKMSMSDTD